MKNYFKKIDRIIEKALLNYIEKLTQSLYPKENRGDDDDDEPILFI